MVSAILKYFKEAKPERAFLISTSAVPLLFFLLLTLRSKVEGNWANMAYPSAFIVLFIYIKEVSWKKYVSTGLIAAGLILSAAISAVILYPLPAIKATGYNLKPADDRTNEVHGWDTLGKEISGIISQQPEGTFIFGLNHQTPAILRFYIKNHPRVYCLPYKLRKTNQYDIWDNWDTLKGKDGLFVIFEPMAEDVKISLGRAFESVKLYKSIPIYREGYGAVPIRTVNLYLCGKFKGKEFTEKPQWY